MKKILVLVCMMIFTGCSINYQQFKDGYKTAKMIYQDAKYVVYEVESERAKIKKEGFGVK